MNDLIKVTRALFSALKAGFKNSIKHCKDLNRIYDSSEPTNKAVTPLVLEVKATELEEVRELIHMLTEHYLDMPEEMRVKFDDWQDKLRGSSR